MSWRVLESEVVSGISTPSDEGWMRLCLLNFWRRDAGQLSLPESSIFLFARVPFLLSTVGFESLLAEAQCSTLGSSAPRAAEADVKRTTRWEACSQDVQVDGAALNARGALRLKSTGSFWCTC